MIKSSRFFWFFLLVLLFQHSNSQSEHGTLYSVPTGDSILPWSNTTALGTTPSIIDNSHLTTNQLQVPQTETIEHIQAYMNPQQYNYPLDTQTGSVPNPNMIDISNINTPLVNPINPYQPYQPVTTVTPLVPPTPLTPQIQTVVIGLNKTISLYSNESMNYLVPVIESKKQSVLFFVINPYENLNYEQTSITISVKGNQTLVNNCQDVGVNVCLIPGEYLKLGDQLNLKIQCVSDETCMFDLQTYWSTTYPMHINKPLIMDFQQDAYAKLFHLDITDKDFKQLRIQLTTKTVLIGDAPIHLYANLGNQPPTKQKHHFAGIHLWDDGLGIFLSKQKINQTQLTIIVEGPGANVLQIEAKVITEYYKLLKLDELQYDYLPANQFRTYYIDLPSKIEDMSLKLSTFTGSVEIDFFKDEQLKDVFMVGQFQTFGDRLYHLPAAHITGNNITSHLFVRVKSGHSPSTYILKLTSSHQKSILLSTDISDMGQIKKGQIVNYHINTYIETSSAYPKVLKFTLHHVLGNNNPFFRLCHQQNSSNCYVDYNAFVNNKSAYDQIKPISVATSGSSSIYKIHLDPNQFILDTHATKYKRAILSVVLAEETDTRFIYGIEYSDDSVIKTLREGTPVKDRVNIGSRRIYRVAPLSKDVLAIHIHLVEISGKVQMYGSKTDPRVQGFQAQGGMDVPIKNELSYQAAQLNANHTIFIVVEGEQNAIFSLTATFKRGIQISQNAQVKDKFNYVSIPANSEQQITIQPQSYEVIFLSTAYAAHDFTYTTSFALKLCARKDDARFPRQPYCDIVINSTRTQLPQSKSYYISIGNPGNTPAVISVKYSNVFHCEQKNLGSVWKKYFEKPQTETCVKYTIHKNQSLEILTSIDTYSYPSMHSTIYINQFQIPLNLPQVLIDIKAFEEHCNPTYCIVVVMFSNLTKSNVQLTAQYLDHELILLDGISQQVHTVSSPNVYKKFSFALANKQDTTIILESKEGTFEFFVSVHDQFQGHLNDQIYPTRENSMLKGHTAYYTLYRTQIITAQDLKKLTCTACVLYISVTGTESSYNEKGRFVIEVTQERRTIKALTLTPGYLSMNSIHYYEYEFKNNNGTLVVSLSTENSKCADTYIIPGKDKVNPMMKTMKSSGDETIVNATKGIYTIAVEATQNCRYTISVSETLIKISEIKQGVYKDLKLKKNQIAYLFYHHAVDTNFKVLSMQEYGEVMISVATLDKAAIDQLGNVTNIDDKALKKFEWPGGKDVIRVMSSDKGYCNDCYYLIYLKAMKDTYTSVILATTHIDIPLTQGDQLTDIMGADEIMYFKMYVYSSKTINISMFVHYGQVEFTVIGTQNNTRTFKKSNETQIWTVSLNENRTASYLPTHFHISSKTNSMYRLIIKTENHTVMGTQKINKQMKFGYPTYLFIDPKVETCAQAPYSENNQKLLVSVSRGEKSKINNFNFTVKIGDSLINNTKNQIIENTMVISLDNQHLLTSNQKTNITYCFQPEKDTYLSLTLIPVATVTFLPENSQILVNKQSNLTLNAAGKLFVEVFQCEGNANILLSKKFIKLKGGVSELNHWRRFGANYLVEIDQTGLIYMNVDGGKTLIRWQHIDRNKGEGLGYYYFSPPHFTYDNDGNKISFEIPPLVQMESIVNKTVIQGINYTVMVSDSKKSLKSAIQCNIGGLVKQNKYVSASEMNHTLIMSMEVSNIKKRYSQKNYIFASIVAQLTLVTPSNKTQVYKFVYEDEQIMFVSEGLTKEADNHEKYGTLFWILWGATLAVIALYFIAKMAIAKYKSRHMSLTHGTDMETNEVDSIR